MIVQGRQPVQVSPTRQYPSGQYSAGMPRIGPWRVRTAFLQHQRPHRAPARDEHQRPPLI